MNTVAANFFFSRYINYELSFFPVLILLILSSSVTNAQYFSFMNLSNIEIIEFAFRI